MIQHWSDKFMPLEKDEKNVHPRVKLISEREETVLADRLFAYAG